MKLRNERFQFGPFTLDLSNRLLLRIGKPISVTPKAFDTLAYLVQNSQRLVTREELMKAVWPDSFVEDANLTVNVSLLRKALGEEEDGHYIETVPRKGYRFNAEVRLVEADAPSGAPEPAQVFPGPEPVTSSEFPAGEIADSWRNNLGLLVPGGGRRSEAAACQPEIIPLPAPYQPQTPKPAAPRTPVGTAESGEIPRFTVKPRRVLFWVGTVIILGLATGGLFWRRLQPPLQLRQRRLTSFAPQMAVTAAAISTGSKFIAYANPGGLFVQVISTGDTHTLALPSPHFAVSSISWFPDSARLLIGGSRPGDTASGIWVVSVIGASQPVLLGPYPSGAVSPDGSEIAWPTRSGSAPKLQLMSSGGGPVQTLVTGADGEVFGGLGWRRNGSALVFTRFRWNPQFRGNSGAIEAYDIRSGKLTMVLAGNDFGGDVVSLPEGRVIFSKIFGANPSAYGGEILAVQTDLRKGVATGSPISITKWNTPVTGLSSNSSGSRLILRDWIVQHSVYLGRLEHKGRSLVDVRRFTLGIGREDYPHAWTPDSKTIFFDSNRNGHWEIFKQAIDSAGDVPFVQGPDDQFDPHQSPDGAWLLYIERPLNWHEPQQTRLMRVPISGGVSQTVLESSGFSEWGLRFACPKHPGLPCVLAQRQGDHIVFRSFDPEKGFQQGSKELGRTDYGFRFPINWCLAADASSIAWVKLDPTDSRVHILPLALSPRGLAPGGKPSAIAINGGPHLRSITWAPDGKSWFVTRQFPGSWELSYVDSRGKASTLLTVQSAVAPDVIPSPDGRYLAFSEQSFASNVWMLEHFER